MYRAPHWRIPRWNYIQPTIWGMTLSSLLTTTGRLMTRPTNRRRQRLLPPAKLRLMTPSQRSCELWHPATTPQSSKVRTTLQESLCWKSITYREAPRRECRPGRKTRAYPLVPLQIFQPPVEPVGFIDESIGAIDSFEGGVALQQVKADAPLQLAQADRAQMQWAAIGLD